jgi:hypothetical protein
MFPSCKDGGGDELEPQLPLHALKIPDSCTLQLDKAGLGKRVSRDAHSSSISIERSRACLVSLRRKKAPATWCARAHGRSQSDKVRCVCSVPGIETPFHLMYLECSDSCNCIRMYPEYCFDIHIRR